MLSLAILHHGEHTASLNCYFLLPATRLSVVNEQCRTAILSLKAAMVTRDRELGRNQTGAAAHTARTNQL